MKETSARSPSNLLSADAAGAPAPDFLTVKETGAGGDELGVDPLITSIPSPLQSVPREPAARPKHQSPARHRQSSDPFLRETELKSSHLHWR